MVIYLGADHRGFNLKETIKKFLTDQGYEVVDMGNIVLDKDDDYTDFAVPVARKVMLDENARGILFCGSGVGMAIAAGKLRKIRALAGTSPDQVLAARHEEDLNVLCLGADLVSEEDVKKMISIFLGTPFSGEERHRRRLDKIAMLENG